jgi:hypothetical protein
MKRRSLVVVVAFFFFILTAGSTLGVIVVGSLHGRLVGGGKSGKGLINEWRLWKRELVEPVDAHPIREVPLVA